MKNLTVFILIVLFSLTTHSQTPTPRNFKKPVSAKSSALEKEEFEKALALADAAQRIQALQKFVEDYPKSKDKSRALELVTSARAALADEKLRAGEREAGIELFKLAVRETPNPISDKLFTEIILQIPNSLFFRGQGSAAVDVARLIEEKADGNAKQLIALATFYLGTENAAEAKRLANRAAQLDAALPAAYQTLGMAHRLDFQFEESVGAFQKALELDPNSNISKRSLAEMKRAFGKPAEAVTLYREILAKDAADGAAQTGLILALFDAENKTEAETELTRSLEANPNNLFLLTGAAYWYAAREQGAKAIELAEKAVAIEPRYTWARIALARGLMQQKRLFEAEKTLLAARQHGDFPTLDYELATARFQSGFYREAAEGLQKKFSVKDNLITTQLGGRIPKDAKNFTELLAAERRASIFQTLAADDGEVAEKLKFLLDFSQKIENSTDETIAVATDEFVKGDDKMKLHRQLFAASQLVQKRKALPKVLELTRVAVGAVEAGLDTPNAAAAVLADELYQSRRIAISRNELIIVPEIPRQTLSNIVRGIIEDLAGWALFQESKPTEAVTRLKRAVSVLPEKSSLWRNAMWRLGTVHETAGNSKDALDVYVKSYQSGEADFMKYGIIETVYQKVNGNLDGLELKIGAKPASVAAAFPVPIEPRKSTVQSKIEVQPTPEIKTEPAPTLIVAEKTVSAPTPVTAETAPPIAEIKSTAEISDASTPIKTDIAPTPETKTEAALSKTEIETKTKIAPSESKTLTREPKTVKDSDTNVKPLFEPVVINVPKVEPLIKSTETQAEEKISEIETPKVEPKIDESNQEKNSIAESVQTRPRVLVTENILEPISGCKITASQETISILSDGGNSSLLVGIEGKGDLRGIKAISNSLSDVEVMLEPDTSDKARRALFIVKSVSRKIGTFKITFESACGKKEIFVKVR